MITLYSINDNIGNNDGGIWDAFSLYLDIFGWWLSHAPEKYEFVSGDDEITNIWKIKNVPNHQPVVMSLVIEWKRIILIITVDGYKTDHHITIVDINDGGLTFWRIAIYHQYEELISMMVDKQFIVDEAQEIGFLISWAW